MIRFLAHILFFIIISIIFGFMLAYEGLIKAYNYIEDKVTNLIMWCVEQI